MALAGSVLRFHRWPASRPVLLHTAAAVPKATRVGSDFERLCRASPIPRNALRMQRGTSRLRGVRCISAVACEPLQAVGASSAETSQLVLAQDALLNAHVLLGTPWWETIVLCTIGLRVLLLPVVALQLRNTARLLGGVAGAQTAQLNSLYKAQVVAAADTEEKWRLTKQYFRGLNGIWRLNRVHPIKSIAAPLVQVPVFLTFVFATRDLVRDGGYGMESGGALWFTDLTSSDPMLVLPAFAIAASYANFELSFGGRDSRVLHIFKDGLQSLLLLSAPFTAQLPSGVFCYWLVSSLCGIGQSLALRAGAAAWLTRDINRRAEG